MSTQQVSQQFTVPASEAETVREILVKPSEEKFLATMTGRRWEGDYGFAEIVSLGTVLVHMAEHVRLALVGTELVMRRDPCLVPETGKQVVCKEILLPLEGKKHRRASCWVTIEELEAAYKAQIKAKKTLAEKAAKIAEAETKRQKDMAAHVRPTKKERGKKGQGKKK